MENEEILFSFISGCTATLNQAEELLLQLEKNLELGTPPTPEEVQILFRFFHNIKGTAGFFELESIISLSHNVESLLDSIRKGKQTFSLDILEVILKSIDELRKLVQEIEKLKQDISLPESAREVIAQIQTLSNLIGNETKTKKKYEIFEEQEDGIKEKTKTSSVPNSIGQVISKKDIRVPESALNQILNLMGELVIAESNVHQHPVVKSLANDSLNSALNHLHKILKEFQELTLSLRMIPLQDLFQRMVRVIRDLQKNSDKQVVLQVSGEETRIDKAIFDALVDPMVHLVRNAFDHGIETPQEREKKGKPAQGKIELQAFQSGNEIWVVVSDDGRGLEKEKIFEKAVQLGFISKDFKLTDEEIYKLIFQSGLSTSIEVTEVSGRGVGMEIIKTSVEKLGGKIEIHSVPEKGVSFVLRLPLTLGIMEGTTFKVENKLFTVPTAEIKEFVGLRDKEKISLENNVKVIDVRNHFIPIFTVEQILSQVSTTQIKENSIVLIFQSNKKEIGIIADEVLGNQTIVIKSMEKEFAKAKLIVGFTILGDGSISLILDIGAMFDSLSSKI